MEKLLNFALIIGMLFLVASCVFTENITFNDDYSGSSETLFDFELFYPYMIDSTAKKVDVDLTIDSMVVELQDKLKEIEGISEVECRFDTSRKVIVNYKFADTESLNGGCNEMFEFLGLKEEDGPEIRKFIVQGKKKLEMQFNAELPDTTADSFNGLTTYSLGLEFAREVKKLENNNESGAFKYDSLNVSENKISYSGDPGPMLKAPKQSVLIKLGKKK